MKTATLRASMFAARRRPGVLTISLVWVFGMVTLFGYGVLYIVYLGLSSSSNPTSNPDEVLRTLMPDRFVGHTIGLYPLYGTVLLIMGALVSGGEYRWGTLSTVLTQRTGRAAVFLGHWLTLVITLLGLTVVTFAVTALVSTLFATIESQPISFPGFGQLLIGIATGWLISCALATFGFFLAIVFRGVTTAIAIGLLWTPGLENAVSLLTIGGSPFAFLQKVLIAPNAGTLAVSAGASSMTPGIYPASSPALSASILLAYILVFLTISILLVRRRDVP